MCIRDSYVSKPSEEPIEKLNYVSKPSEEQIEKLNYVSKPSVDLNREGKLCAVSYTHLDVYKRQVKVNVINHNCMDY